jgi:hypothetical protein
MKLFAVGVKILAQPALLPVALATFVSLAGPGGIAEISHNVTAVPTVVVTTDSPTFVASVHSGALLIQVEERPSSIAPVFETEPPSAPPTEEVVSTVSQAPGAGGGEAITQDTGPSAPAPEPVDGGEPTTDSNTPSQPAATPNDSPDGDTPASPVTDPQAPPDGNPEPENPADDGDKVGDQPPADDGGDDVGDPTNEGPCDVPGNGHDKHEVEPGHDKNNDGIDDRCQQDDGAEPPVVETPAVEPPVVEPPVDNSEGDVADDSNEPECDVPGNGHDKHEVEPGHDKNNDGVDDRCQEDEANSPNQNGSQDNNGASETAHHQNDARKDDS